MAVKKNFYITYMYLTTGGQCWDSEFLCDWKNELNTVEDIDDLKQTIADCKGYKNPHNVHLLMIKRLVDGDSHGEEKYS